MLSTDVLIVGAGPAGTAAAIELARCGRDVTIIDKATFPRDKCCGDGLTTEALRILEGLGVTPGTVQNWNEVTDIVIRNPRGREARLPLPPTGQYAAVVPRLDLDDRLVQLAREAGVHVREGVSFRTIQRDTDGPTLSPQPSDPSPSNAVTTETSAGAISSRYVIAADGMWSPVRKDLGLALHGYRGEWHAFRQYFSGVGPQAQHLVVWFEKDLLPGYAWSFPLPGQRANVGFGITRRGHHQVGDMKAIWEDLLTRPHVRAVLGDNAVPEDRHKAWPIPARVDTLPKASGRVLFVGDAVGATDPMTGEGIAQALLSGQLAARAIEHGGATRPAVTASRYEQSIQQSLVADHRLARRLARLLETSLGARSAIRAADLTPWTRRNFARWMFEDYPRAMALTPDRWHRGMFSRVGAFTAGDGVAEPVDGQLTNIN